MSSRFRLAAALLLVAGPALASPCTERISALEPRIDEAAEQTVAVSSGGQGVAAAREGQAMQAENEGAPIAPATVPPFQDEAAELEATRDVADASGGGDRVMQARVMLNEARTLDGDGNSAACLEKVDQIEAALDPQ